MGAMLISAWGGPQPMNPAPNSDSPGNKKNRFALFTNL